MASLALAGAVGGAARGLGSFLSAEMQAERAAALENIKNQNKIASDERGHKYDMERLDKQGENQLSLERLRQEAPSQGQDPAAVATAKFLQLPPEKGGLSLSPDEAWREARAKSGMSRRDYFGSMASTYAEAGYEPAEAASMARQVTEEIYGPEASQPPAPGEPQDQGAGPKIPEAAITQFKAMGDTPETRAQFDEVFGPGAAEAQFGPPQDGGQQPAADPQASAAPPVEEEFTLAGMKGGSSFTPQGGYSANAAPLRETLGNVADAASNAWDSVKGKAGDMMDAGRRRQDSIQMVTQAARMGASISELPTDVLRDYLDVLEQGTEKYDEVAMVLERRGREQMLAGS
jgi:hypothetical protein